MGLGGALSRGSDWRGLLTCVHSGPPPAPPKGTALWSTVGSMWGWALKVPLGEAPITITTADATTDPTEQLGPQSRVTLTSPAIETDRGGALPHNAQAHFPPPPASTSSRLCPPVPGVSEPLSFRQTPPH